jgi:ParB family transcriptional regulator, chromosome partitioning protein
VSGNRERRRRFSVDDLFADTRTQAVGVSELTEAKLIQLDRIEADPDQPRREFDTDRLAELAASIRTEGVLQPIAVRYESERDIYVIVHGERRWRAAGEAGLSAIPAVVRDVPEDRRLLQQLMENIIREDLNALDRARALRALKTCMDDAPWEQVAEAVGIRRSRLFQLLGTEKLSSMLQDVLRQGLISEKQTRSVQALPDEIQDEIAAGLRAGILRPADVDAAARAVRDAASLDEARQTLATFQGSTPVDTSSDTDVRRIRRMTRNLTRALSALEGDSAGELIDDLEALSDEIENVTRSHKQECILPPIR